MHRPTAEWREEEEQHKRRISDGPVVVTTPTPRQIWDYLDQVPGSRLAEPSDKLLI